MRVDENQLIGQWFLPEMPRDGDGSDGSKWPDQFGRMNPVIHHCEKGRRFCFSIEKRSAVKGATDRADRKSSNTKLSSISWQCVSWPWAIYLAHKWSIVKHTRSRPEPSKKRGTHKSQSNSAGIFSPAEHSFRPTINERQSFGAYFMNNECCRSEEEERGTPPMATFPADLMKNEIHFQSTAARVRLMTSANCN